jgi:hypothetical protein
LFRLLRGFRFHGLWLFLLVAAKSRLPSGAPIVRLADKKRALISH